MAASVVAAPTTTASGSAPGMVTLPGTAGASSSSSGMGRPSWPSSLTPHVQRWPSSETATECTPEATATVHLGRTRR